MRRETQNILLILLGGALLKIALNGDYLRYVKPSQQPWVIAGGAVMLLLGLFAVGRDMVAARRALSATSTTSATSPKSTEAVTSAVGDGRTESTVDGAPAESAACGGAAHTGHAHSARSAWLLMVPVLAVFLVAPPALGADSVARTQARAPRAAGSAATATFPPLPPGPVVPLSVSAFVSRAGWDSGGTLDNRVVSLSGFVVHNRGGTMLARMVISCCAADAFPVTVQLLGAGPPGAGEQDPGRLPSDTWITVTGTAVPHTANSANSYTPDLRIASVRQQQTPRDPYEY